MKNVKGDVREDGFIFSHIGCGREHWYSPEAYHRTRLNKTLDSARKRAKASKLPFDLDTDYLVAIFPADAKCPALGIPLEWGNRNGYHNSPSIDRIIPSKGYTRGNVRFLSNKANLIKSNATPEEVLRVAQFMNKESD